MRYVGANSQRDAASTSNPSAAPPSATCTPKMPAATAIAEVRSPKRVGIVHFDAHADTANDGWGVLASHGAPMRRLIESGAIDGRNFVQVGLRGYLAKEILIKGPLHLTVIADGEDLLKAAADVSGESFAVAREKFAEKLGNARARVADASQAVAGSARKSAAVADEYVHDSPWIVIGIAAAAGMLIGFLAARR